MTEMEQTENTNLTPKEELMQTLRINLDPDTLEELHKINSKWFHLTEKDYEYLEVAYACAIDRHIKGDPIWIYLIAPPGGMKTTVARMLKLAEKIYTIDSLTKHTFISGLARKNRETGEIEPIAGLLTEIDGKVLIIKDFTTILSKHKDDRAEIFGQLRSIYDGYYESAFGTSSKKISVECHIGLIVCVTPVIDKYTRAHTSLGERFLKIRQNPDPRATSKRARKNIGKEEQMNNEMAKATANYLKKLKTYAKQPTLTEEQDDIILEISLLVAKGRAPIMCRYYQGQIIDMDLVEPEVPTRLIKQLTKLAICLAIVRKHENVTEKDIDTIKRVARDTMNQKRLKILMAIDTLQRENEARTPGEEYTSINAYQISKISKIHHMTVTSECDKMKMLELINIDDLDNTYRLAKDTANSMQLFRPMGVYMYKEERFEEVAYTSKANRLHTQKSGNNDISSDLTPSEWQKPPNYSEES